MASNFEQNLNVTGSVTATSFSGDGSGLTNVGASAGGITSVVIDITPQLGGNLDLNSNNINGTGNIATTGNISASGNIIANTNLTVAGNSAISGNEEVTGDLTVTGIITGGGSGTPTLTSTTDIKLQAGTGATDRVEVSQSPFKFSSFTTTQRDAKTSENGDMIYNTTNARLEGYQNSSWSALSGSGGGYADSDVDTHLNQSNPTSGYVLSWNGTDYAWVAQSGGGGGLANVVDDTTPELGGDLATNSNKITFGTAAELQMYNTGTKSIITSATDDMYFQRTSDSVPAYFFEAINDGFAGPYISLKHDTVSPSTIDFATIAHDGKNDAAEDIAYSSIQFTTRSITDGTESGKIIFNAMRFGTNKTLLTINPTYADVEIGDNGAVRISRGSTPLRPTGETGMIRYNTTTSSFEGYGDSAWGDITNLEHTFTMTSNGSSDYVFASDSKFFTANTNDPILYLRRGETYNFVNNSGGSHPFQIRLSNGGSAYSTGVTNNGASSGNIVFTVPMGAPTTLYYQCTSHASMGNVINIV